MALAVAVLALAAALVSPGQETPAQKPAPSAAVANELAKGKQLVSERR